MIYIVGIPHQMAPFAFYGENKQDIINRIYEAAVEKNGDDEIYIAATGRTLVESYGFDTVEKLREEAEGSNNCELTSLSNLIDQIGLDTMIYKGWRDEEYHTKPLDAWATSIDYHGHDLYSQKVFMSEEEALAALEDDSEWDYPQGWKARAALKEVLRLTNCDEDHEGSI